MTRRGWLWLACVCVWPAWLLGQGAAAPVIVVETSRGCTFDCSFCSIIEMRGRNFNVYPINRVLADIADARDRGARAVFLVDDNITLDVQRFESLCRAIIERGLNDIEYLVQAMTSPLAHHGATLAPLMKRAGFRYVFLGIENILESDLDFLKARAKNALREHGRLATAGLGGLSDDADDVAEVHLDLTRDGRVADRLNASGAIDDVEEDELPHLAPRHRAARDPPLRLGGAAVLERLRFRSNRRDLVPVGEALRSGHGGRVYAGSRI